ncbi:hypothetical protein PG911_12745 [Tenacibaculum ovolyticum]|uniref:hypothetical protein n=1 Tax=Tenacibaculum ovolyticum TaxID=104270 RepID=UPI0022F39165|nr:hypothetical protein [Tenacibaculum ovolyticum]WBX75519.1 hypothetical protein PG911_12745 [Tenacibaculum ovolyticum]
MSKDIREVLKNRNDKPVEISKDHRKKFQQKLMKELHSESSKKKSYQWLYIAASIVMLLGLGVNFYPTSVATNEYKNEISLGSVSPELKTIESYYINTINYELSQLELTDDTKEFFDGYFAKIGELTKEYKSLTEELNTKGINDNTINALIGNLQLRLQLLKRMQKQLNELKNTNQNDIQAI